MKCPLSPPSTYPELNKTSFRLTDCLQAECAWWDGHGGFCSILKISRHLESMWFSLDNIATRKEQEE